MGSITGFQAESPLHPKAREALLGAFDQGWAEPRKVHQASRKAALIRDEARESLSSDLSIHPEKIHFLGESSLGFHLGITGLLKPSSAFYYPAISRQQVHASAQALSETHETQQLPSALDGSVVENPAGTPGDLLAWQVINGETGIRLPDPHFFKGSIFLDATATSTGNAGPWDAGLWESGTWSGPRGLGIFALNSPEKWSNPLPHLDSRVVPGDRSVPLVIASAIALRYWREEETARHARLRTLNERIRHFAHHEIGDVDIAGSAESSLLGDPSKLSLSFLYVDAEHLMQELDRRGFAVDSGSACSSMELKPSHVLAAMGLLTQGNIRLSLKMEMDDEYIASFLNTLKELVHELR